ncbi:MAG: MaoC family dehydratase N-terminal domain-containing protein, partial [Deltaproteobacteria bacterium]|nr:MaoC family dehydratase N-terminal domain-containing protein [Deltaproteobacteria bacterium]
MMNPEEVEVIETHYGPVTEERVNDFLDATGSEYVTGVPPTFQTLFRHAEYEWLDRLKIDVRGLIHGEQDYEYLQAFEPGRSFLVRTELVGMKERQRPHETLFFIVFK